MKRILAALVLSIGIGIGVPNQANAIPVPVIDIPNLVENILARIDGALQLIEAYNQTRTLVDQYDQMLQDYQNQTKQLLAMTGFRGTALLRNSLFERQTVRRYMPANWSIAVDMRYGGGDNSRYHQALLDVMERYDLPEVWDAFEGTDESALRDAYDDRLRGSQAAMAASEVVQLTVAERLEIIEDLLAENAGTGPNDDLKRSIDLNTRMNAEVAFMTAEMIRLLAQQTMLGTIEDQEELAIEASRRRMLKAYVEEDF